MSERASMADAPALKGEAAMGRTLRLHLPPETLRVLAFAAFLIVFRAGLFVYLALRGFVSVSADEFSRGIRAAEWAVQPRIDLLADFRAVWLPMEMYLNGLALRVWPDVFWTPRLTVFVASCIALLGLFVATRFAFDSWETAGFASLLALFHPWVTWLSSTPMLEMYYLAPLLWGFAFLLLWLRQSRPGSWFWAALCMMLSTGFHVQSWILVNIVNLMTLGFVVKFVREKRFSALLRMIGYYFLSNALVILTVVVQYLSTGKWFAFLGDHTTYSRWFYSGYNVAVSEKLLYYPRLTIRNVSGIALLLMVVAVVLVGIGKSRRWRFAPLVLALLALGVFSAMNALSGPPSAAPERYSVFYVLVLSPYAGYALNSLWVRGSSLASSKLFYARRTIAVGLFVYCIAWGLVRIPKYPQGMSQHAVEAGNRLHILLDASQANSQPAHLIELKYWDFLAVKLMAGHYQTALFDREYDIFNRNTPSVFLKDAREVSAYLRDHGVRFIALQDPELKAAADSMGFLILRDEIAEWAIYAVVD